MRTLLKYTLRFFLPWACVGCRSALLCLDDEGFCGRCWLKLPRIQGWVCQYCGLPLPDGGEICYSCRHMPLSVIVRAATEYKGSMPAAIHRFKYFGRKTLAVPFGRLLQSTLTRYAELQPLEGLVPVPLYKGGQRIRGFNQAQALAENLARFEGIPVLSCILSRKRSTTPQYRLDKPARQENMHGAFEVSSDNGVRGMHLLLIDDVCTTGATLQECARVLRRAGAASVKALVLARDL